MSRETEKSSGPKEEAPGSSRRGRGQSAPRAKLQETIFAPGGPAPRASMGTRALAFAMDFILLMTACVLLLWRFILPAQFPEAFAMYPEFARESIDALRSGEAGAITEPDPRIVEMFTFANGFIVIVFYCYFAAGDYLMRGASLGKRIFRLRVLDKMRVAPPALLPALGRSAIKVLCLFTFPLLLLNFFVPWTNRLRQAGHDFAVRTVVVRESAALQ